MADLRSARLLILNEVRIIGGRWRSRKLRFPSVEGLRPTPGRVRETLFNWLRDDLEGAACLDLYAGSGALGFEAVSRGARRVVMVDTVPSVLRALKENCEKLAAPEVSLRGEGAIDYLKGPPEPFDLVFLDPPFCKNWLRRAATLLERGGWLTPRALIYLEGERAWDPQGLPSTWRLCHEGTAGDVTYRLFQRLLED